MVYVVSLWLMRLRRIKFYCKSLSQISCKSEAPFVLLALVDSSPGVDQKESVPESTSFKVQSAAILFCAHAGGDPFGHEPKFVGTGSVGQRVFHFNHLTLVET